MKYGKARAIVESAIEQLDELSKGTYGSYIKRAAANIDYEKTDTNPQNEEDVEKKVRRRLRGIGHAVKALGGQYRGSGNKKKVNEAATPKIRKPRRTKEQIIADRKAIAAERMKDPEIAAKVNRASGAILSGNKFRDTQSWNPGNARGV